MNENGQTVLVYEEIGNREIVYNYELYRKFNTIKLWLIETYKELEDKDSDEYYINKVYRDENGKLWLVCYKVNENKLIKNIRQIFYIL
jgi:hypothetical protein